MVWALSELDKANNIHVYNVNYFKEIIVRISFFQKPWYFDHIPGNYIYTWGY